MSKVFRFISIVLFALSILGTTLDVPVAYAQSQTIVYVDAQQGSAVSPSGSNPGDSWEHAYKYFQDGLVRVDQLHVSPNQSVVIEVRVADGTYVADEDAQNQAGTNIRATSFTLRRYTKVFGGYRGTPGTSEQGEPNDHNPAEFVTILSGDIQTVDDYSDNSYHVVTASDANMLPADTWLAHVTITKGNAEGFGGGGFYMYNEAAPRLHNCIITDNRAGDAGEEEGVSCNAPVVNVGAGGFCFAASPVLTKCVISDNLPNENAFITGGGLAFYSGEPKIIDCIITDNNASRGVGIGVLNRSEPTILNCLIKDNVMVEGNGGINGSYNGGGICVICDESVVSIVNCTIVNNSSFEKGGGIAQFAAGNATVVSIHNTIIWDNTASHTTGKEVYLASDAGSMYATACCVKNRTNTTGVVGSVNWVSQNIDSDPNFVSSTDYHLECPSDCIDGGDVLSSTDPIPNDEYDLDNDTDVNEDTPDLDLRPRAVFPPDIGAYEHQGLLVPCDADINDDGVVNIEDVLAVINSWGSCSGACPADIAPRDSACDTTGDGEVNIDDLLFVLNNWGWDCATQQFTNVGSLSSVEDCMEYCTNLIDPPYSEMWFDCLNSCVEALCEAEIIECD